MVSETGSSWFGAEGIICASRDDAASSQRGALDLPQIVRVWKMILQQIRKQRGRDGGGCQACDIRQPSGQLDALDVTDFNNLTDR